jgi:integrase
MNYALKPLVLPEHIRKARLGHYVWCGLCNTNVNSTCKQSGKRLSSCQHPDRHRYQSRAFDPLAKAMRPVKTWPKELRNYKDFARLHLDLIKNKSTITIESTKAVLVTHCMAYFIDYLSDAGVASYERKNLSAHYIKSQTHNLKQLKTALLEKDIDLRFLPITDLNKSHVMMMDSWLVDQGYSPKTYNEKMATLKAFFKFLIDDQYQLLNIFDRVKYKSTTASKKVLSLDLFDTLLASLNEANGVKLEKKGGSRIGRKLLYRPWLADIFTFALWSGCRPEEIHQAKVADIHTNHLKAINYKVSKAKGSGQVIRMVAMIAELRQLLDTIVERDQLKPSDYIIAPLETNRPNVTRVASDAFTHYISQITEEKYRFYDLRNTYSTIMYKTFGRKFGGKVGVHSIWDTTVEHYVNDEELINEFNGVKVS